VKLKSLSLFFPAYNDEHTIGNLVKAALTAGEEAASDYEVIVIDDGSKDSTGPLLDKLAEGNDRVRVIHHPQNRGYGAALRSGFTACRKEWIFYTDGDGQYDVTELRRLVPFTDRADIINGYKLKRSDPVLRRIFGALYHLSCKIIFNIKIRDVDCDFRLLRSCFIKKLRLVSNGGAICVEMIRKLQDSGARFHEVSVHHYHRRHGRSQFFARIPLLIVVKEILGLWIDMMVLKKR
jgi:glycosyltransferase involved in cell wall biosynthesis